MNCDDHVPGKHTSERSPLMETYVKAKATLIQRFDGSTLLLSPKAKKIELDVGTKLEEVEARMRQLGWIIAIEHLHGEKKLRTG
jgi:hypothetical protein